MQRQMTPHEALDSGDESFHEARKPDGANQGADEDAATNVVDFMSLLQQSIATKKRTPAAKEGATKKAAKKPAKKASKKPAKATKKSTRRKAG